MREDPASYDKFRFHVLHRCLVSRFRQDEREVVGLLRAEINGRHDPASINQPDRELVAEDRVPEDGGKPLAELAVIVIDDIERPDRWGAMAVADVEWPITWLSQLVFWRVRDRLRGGGDRAPGPPPPPPPARHRVAAWIANIASADADNGGFLEGARGMHAMIVRKIIEELDDLDVQRDPNASPSYVLRKLFPPVAWPPEHHTATAVLASWLLARLASTWNVRHDWAATADALGLAGRPALRFGLDESAARHLAAADFPSTTEVALWVGDVAPTSLADPHLNKLLNTLQRRVGRIDDEIEPFVRVHHDRLRRIAKEVE